MVQIGLSQFYSAEKRVQDGSCVTVLRRAHANIHDKATNCVDSKNSSNYQVCKAQIEAFFFRETLNTTSFNENLKKLTILI